MAMTDMAVVATPPQQQLAKPKVKERKGMVGYPVPPQAKARTGLDIRGPDKIEVELARQDVFRVCNPDFRRPFSSLEDACERLLPYHVVAEYDPDEMEVSTSESQYGSALLISRAQTWNDTLKAKSLEYMGVLEKQINTFNAIMRRRAEGNMRGEERLLCEKWLLVDERQKLADARSQIEAKEKAAREAQEARVKEALAQAERARAEALARAEAQAQAEAARAAAIAQVEAAQQAVLNEQSHPTFLPDTSMESELPQPPLIGENLENLEGGWGTSEGEEEIDGGQPRKEDYEEDEEEDASESLFAEDDGAGNIFGSVDEVVLNEFGDGGELQYNSTGTM